MTSGVKLAPAGSLEGPSMRVNEGPRVRKQRGERAAGTGRRLSRRRGGEVYGQGHVSRMGPNTGPNPWAVCSRPAAAAAKASAARLKAPLSMQLQEDTH